ncbi:hypothetical protein [Bradyrhizobium sp. ORS 111]|uniref:hypothetical protein n=1 Tax=Bradyrhizobium sp. ORS 111 TaxID=1685958 RepID=UPI00388E05EC
MNAVAVTIGVGSVARFANRRATCWKSDFCYLDGCGFSDDPFQQVGSPGRPAA